MDYTSLLKENWIMLTSICLSLLPLATILLLLLYPKPITSFRISSSSSSSSSRQRQQQQRVLWHEDAQYMECHGDLHQELNSNQSQQLLEDYNEKEPHVTHFCFLVHGLAGFSQVRVHIVKCDANCACCCCCCSVTREECCYCCNHARIEKTHFSFCSIFFNLYII